MNYSLILFTILVCGAKQIISNENSAVNSYKELKSILSNGYEKEIPPGLGENRTTEVKISLHILDYDFCEKEKNLHTDTYFRQGWTDPRISRPDSEGKVIGGHLLAEKLWRPDTFSLSTETKTVKYPNPNVFVAISPDGAVWYSMRLQQTTRCSRSGETAYECVIRFESYGFSAKDILYKLKKGQDSMSITTLAADPDKTYKLVNSTIEEKFESLSMGEFSNIKITLLFDNKREPLNEEPVKEAVKESSKPNVDVNMNEGKKLHKMFSKINIGLP